MAKKEAKVKDSFPQDKKQALATTLARIEKDFGKGAIMKLGENASMNVSAVPTGSLTLDLALGIGGLPRGRIIEIYGPESSGLHSMKIFPHRSNIFISPFNFNKFMKRCLCTSLSIKIPFYVLCLA